jgi:signal transduction histidine kinase
LSIHGFAQTVNTTSPPVRIKGFRSGQITAGNISYFIDSSGSSGFPVILQTPFSDSYSSFQNQFNRLPAHAAFWLKFTLENESDSSTPGYLYCGDINFTDLYLISDGQIIDHEQGGDLRNIHSGQSFIRRISPAIPTHLPGHKQIILFLKLVQKTEDYSLEDIYLYDEHAIYQTTVEDYEGNRYFVIFQLLFQGILICQLLYVLFQWIIIRRKEYLYYFFYLLAIVLYFLSKYESVFYVNLLFSRYPLLAVYLNKTLLILPYFFYFRFVRNFLEMPLNYPALNKWIVRIEFFLLAYLVFDLSFILITFNVRLQRQLYSYILFLVFLTAACFIFYLFREKKRLIYYILSGSLFAGLGNVTGLVLTFLEDEGISHSLPYKLIFSQIGIILEIFCFTAGLSYKSLSAEKEKTKSQENLIEQLKANELLQTKMQNIRNRIAQDLHDEIGSTLSSISILSNLALKEKNTGQTMATMSEIKDSSMTLMEKMDDIVWSINPGNDSLENLLSRVKRFATALFEAKNIDYTITIPENINEVKLPMDFRQHIYLLLKEAINNLVKYADATKAVIQVSYPGSVLEIMLRDNGKGFDTGKLLPGNGITSMKNRAALMKADLIITSSSGIGSTVLLRLEIK